MNRIEFMRQLESLLQNIPPAEREAALQYYNEYFNDAGVENEQEVIETLGNPFKVAENIKKDLNGGGYTEEDWQKTTATDHAVVEYGKSYYNNTYTGGTADTTAATAKKPMSTGMIVLIIILCIFFGPVLMGLAVALFGVIVSFLASWFAVIFAFGAVAVTLLAVMLFLLVQGIGVMLANPMVGAGLLAAGLICGGVGILFLMLTVAMAGIATPAIFKGLISLCKMPFKKKEQV